MAKARARQGLDRDEGIAERAGAAYADAQVTSELFDHWVWEQLCEGEKLRPEQIAEGLDTESIARGGNAAREVAENMLEQLRWDIERDLSRHEVVLLLDEAGADHPASEGVQRAFWRGLRDALESKDYVAWLADSLVAPGAAALLKKTR